MSFVVNRKKPAKLKKVKAPRLPKPRKPPAPRAPRAPAAKGPERRPIYRGPPMVLRPFQREGVDFLAKNDHRVLLADAPGCGKTPQVLMAIRENPRKLCPALVVVPASVVQNWRNEAERWIPGVNVCLAATTAAPLDPRAHITVTTWDLLATRAEEYARAGFRYLVCDEAHYAKNPEAQRTKGLVEVASAVPHITLLTGTPLVNDEEEYHGLMRLIDPEEGNPPILRRLLENVAPDIPQKKRIILPAEIPDEIRREYEEVVQVYEQWLNEYLPKVMENLSAVSAVAERAVETESLSKLSYLRRVLGRGKVPAAAAWALDLVKGKREQVVIFGQYVDVLDLLGQALSKLGITYVRLDGTTSQEQRQAAVEAFQKKQVDVFLGSQAAREGITLTNACNLLFLERWWTPAAEEQAEDRIRRIGQTRSTTIWYLHAENSLDDRIEEIVERKRRLMAHYVGMARTETNTHGEVMNVWRRIKVLSNGVPLLAHNPKATLDIPPLPSARQIFSVVFAPQRWPSDALMRHMRKNGCRTRQIERGNGVIRVQSRSVSAFAAGSIKRFRLAEGLWLEIGKPETRDAARMAIVRKERTRLGVRALTTRRIRVKGRGKRRAIKLS